MIHPRTFLLGSVLLIASLALFACSDGSGTDVSATPTGSSTVSAPVEAKESPLAGFFINDSNTIGQLQQAAHCVSLLSDWQDNGEPVTVAARIGGRADPFVNGRAVMLISQSDGGDACSACRSCGSHEFTALVQLSDEDKAPLAETLRGANGLHSGSKVLVHGHVLSMDGGRPLIDATSLAVLP